MCIVGIGMVESIAVSFRKLFCDLFLLFFFVLVI